MPKTKATVKIEKQWIKGENYLKDFISTKKCTDVNIKPNTYYAFLCALIRFTPLEI